MHTGKVWLIGCGPGDMELLTLKAARILQSADVWLVDDLAGKDILTLARADARIVHVGKRGGCRSTPQHFINRLMARYARQGFQVARVKGGDAMLFGRGGEEQAYLHEHGIETGIVNGLTSGMAAATSLGVPLTHRDHCRGVAFVTAHGHDGDEPDWSALARSGLTLAIYMGMKRLDRIRAGLLAGGLSPTTPAAIVQSASTPSERQLLTTLDELPQAASREQLASPAIVLVGTVIGLAGQQMMQSGCNMQVA